MLTIAVKLRAQSSKCPAIEFKQQVFREQLARGQELVLVGQGGLLGCNNDNKNNFFGNNSVTMKCKQGLIKVRPL